MKTNKLLTTLALATAVFITACSDLNNAPSLTGPDQNGLSLNSGHHGGKSHGSLAGVNLGTAGNFAILSESGITDVYKSDITGNVGTSPITGAALLVSCDEVVGTIYTVDAAGPLPCRITSATMLTTAVGDMQAAYVDAAGRVNPDFLNL